MTCEFCGAEIKFDFLCEGCREKLTEFMFSKNGFGFLAASMCCIDLSRLLDMAEIGVNKANDGTLPALRPPSEIAETARAIVAGLTAAASSRLERQKEIARRIGVCMACNVPGSIPIGGRPIEAPGGTTIYSAKCAPCTKKGADAWLKLMAEKST